MKIKFNINEKLILLNDWFRTFIEVSGDANYVTYI